MGQKFSDAARSELLSAITAAATTINLLSGGDKFPAANAGTSAVSDANDWFKLVLQDASGYEIVYVRSHPAGTDQFTNVLRGQDGTTAKAFAAGTVVGLRQTAADAADVLTRIAAREPTIPVGGADDYWTGSKTWTSFLTKTRAVTLAGLSTATNAVITAADTVLSAFGKLQKQISDHLGAGGAAHAAATTSAAGFMSSADKTKIDGIASNATANATDSQLRDRSTHTGTQAISTVSGLQTALDGKAAVGSTAGANLGTASAGSAATAARSDHVHKLPTAAEVGAAPAAHATDTNNPHSVTAAQVGAAPSAHVGAGGTAHANATTSVDGFMSSADKTKLDGIASGATANATDAQLRDRSTHTGTQAQSTVTNLTSDLAARVNREDSYSTVTSGSINLAAATELYHASVSADVTLTPTNIPSSTRRVVRLALQYTSGVVTFNATYFALPASMPTFAAGKTYLFSLEQSPSNANKFFVVPAGEYTTP